MRQEISSIAPLNEDARKACWRHWDSLCKPLRGFGRFEEMVVQIGAIQGTDKPEIEPASIVIMAADNGVVSEGVSQSGSEVTAQVLENMGESKSSVSLMGLYCGAQVYPVNIGMLTDGIHPAILNRAVIHGTGDIMKGPAMTRSQAVSAIEEGIQIVRDLRGQGCKLIITGEMGIGNTTTSSACVCALFGCDPIEVAGVGAGLGREAVRHKAEVIREAIFVNAPDRNDPIDILSKVGGLDIAGMCGLFLGAALCGIPALIDGMISAVASYLATMVAPAARDYMLPTHRSAEPAFDVLMKALAMEPVLCAGMHLGEGTGAAAVYVLLQQMIYLYYRLPSFNEGKVEQYKHLK